MADVITRAPLATRVRGLLRRAAISYEGHVPATERLGLLAARFDEPLRVAVGGRVKSGKSTLLNALVGEPLAATDAAECTRIVTWYRHGPRYRVVAEHRDGWVDTLPFTRGRTSLAIEVDPDAVDRYDRLVVEWPAAVLDGMTLIDTPGLGSLSTDLSDRAVTFLAPDDDTSGADAVIYLTRHLHAHDVRFLEAFRDDDAGRPSPVNAIAVVSRADEIGGAHLGAMESAERVASRYRTDPQVRRLCQTVVPVAGLLAQGATQLVEADFRALGCLAETDDDTCDALLASTDRFVDGEIAAGLTTADRRQLLELLGLFGVRLGRELIRTDVATSAQALAGELRRRSGLDRLRSLLATQFASRSDLLKSRAALSALDALVHTVSPNDGGALAGAIEEVAADAHELAELRVLLAVRAGLLDLDDQEQQEIERVVDRASASPVERLGLDDHASIDDVRREIIERVERWRRAAEYPLATTPVVDAATVMVRTYEGLLPAAAAVQRD